MHANGKHEAGFGLVLVAAGLGRDRVDPLCPRPDATKVCENLFTTSFFFFRVV